MNLFVCRSPKFRKVRHSKKTFNVNFTVAIQILTNNTVTIIYITIINFHAGMFRVPFNATKGGFITALP